MNDNQLLPYTIKGKQLDSNMLSLDSKGQKLIWRTDKSQSEIESILQEIHIKIQEIAKSFDINTDEIMLYSLPLISSKKIMKTQRETQNLHSCHYDFKQSSYTPFIAKELLAQRNLKEKKGDFLNKKLIAHANKKLKKAQAKHLLFCKNSPKYTPKIPQITINANIFLCQNKDWITEYKQSIKPVICARFYIRPSWHEENRDYENLIIDPSLSFGSGHHATTAMCIDLLSEMELRDKNMLDVGCGSGILSLVAAKLHANIYACDTDIEACNQSKKNFAINNLLYKEIWQGSLQSLKQFEVPKSYDVICANIVSSVLLLLKKDLIFYLKQDGILILSGILQEHEAKILEGFKELTLLEKKQIDEWLCFKFIKK